MKGIADHLFRGSENVRIEVLQGSETAIGDAVSDARAWNRTYAFRHWIIAPEEPTTRDQALHLLEALAIEFGFEPKVATLIEHEKPRVNGAFNLHWHAIVPEVDPATGRVLSSSYSYARHEKVARASEVLFGQKAVPGPHQSAVIAQLKSEGQSDVADEVAARVGSASVAGEAFSNAVHQAGKRVGVELPRLRAFVRDSFAEATTKQDFVELLAREGLSIALGDKAFTWVVSKGGTHFVGAGHRLAGVEKAEFHRKMEVVDVGEPGHAQRGRKHTERHPGDTASRKSAGPDAHGNLGGPRGGLVDEQDRGGAGEFVASGSAPSGRDRGASREARHSAWTVWRDLAEDRRLEIALTPHDKQLQTIREAADRLSISSSERLRQRLAERRKAIEKSLSESERDLPLPDSLDRANQALQAMKTQVSEATSRRDAVRAAIQATEKTGERPRSWLSRLRSQPEPEVHPIDQGLLEAAERNLRGYEMALRGAQYRVNAEERSYSEANRAHHQLASERKYELTAELTIVDRARHALENLRLPWRSGYSHFIASVAAQIERERRREEIETIADFDGVPKTDMWGIGIVPKPR